ncbi:hypothetical protein [Pelodictyon phaeoclathratiforme]|uniref:hypothetical protein n=1 Tax=Pelodictyon phaeoclathratiforme TaxID=34090 RepID=UPI0002D8182F|nr:hypothetical protein [Pelodictyon phaeoclathratiforme]MBV5288518.1 hypothetical protein [Pelodictyon phaeoclathratiforme]
MSSNSRQTRRIVSSAAFLIGYNSAWSAGRKRNRHFPTTRPSGKCQQKVILQDEVEE